MAIGEINIIPLGTKTPSVSSFIVNALKILEEYGIKYELTAMGTIVEGDIEKIFDLAKKMHNSVFEKGSLRVVTTVKIDERRDKKSGIERKVEAVKERLKK